MLVAFISDIHANLEALNVVLAELDSASPDETYCLGDIVGYAANPHECVDAIRTRNIPTVAGNHDLAVSGVVDTAAFNREAQSSISWTRAAVTESDLLFLRTLPLSRQTALFAMAHGSLNNPGAFDYVLNATNAYLCFRAHNRPVAFISHSHVPTTFFLHGDELLATSDAEFHIPEGMRALVNVGSVGQPRDGNPDAAFTLFDTETRRVSLRRVAYDVETTARKILAAGLPAANALRLSVGR